MSWNRWCKTGLAGMVLSLMLAMAQAAITTRNMVSDIRGTKHNLSSQTTYFNKALSATLTVPTRNIKASSEDQVCVFCHTPHGASSAVVAPLWNRKLSTASYTMYSSSSIDAYSVASGTQPTQPGDSSKLCLSCHDGTMAIGDVLVNKGALTQSITMSGSTTMPVGLGVQTGFTRNLGTDLTNDHPISFTYNAAVAGSDGELRSPDNVVVGNRVVLPNSAGSSKVKLPLINNQIECATCHDPHIRDLNEAFNGNAKFLRLNRFQITPKTTSGTVFNSTNDIMCLACHNKGDDSWNLSAHAVASQTYANTSGTTTYREFPALLTVSQAACLNCHDTHTVQGSRRLLREGVGLSSTITNGYQPGYAPGNQGKSAIELTCYTCHDGGASNLLSSVTSVPNIAQDFGLTYRMPVITAEQGISGTLNTTEVHDITSNFADTFINCSATPKCGADLMEPQAKLGLGNLANRHAECTDCHNPHRVIKGQNGLPGILTVANTSQKSGTHIHEDGTEKHTNLISGVLRGAWGVEPIYSSQLFNGSGTLPTFAVKRGDPGSYQVILSGTASDTTYVTREYQICLKCHSNYAYGDNNKYPSDTTTPLTGRPLLGGPKRTAANISPRTSYTTYTNQAMEFQADSTHKKDVNATGVTAGGWGSGYATNNHRSWHPVMGNTGRTAAERGGLSANNWRAPWNNDLGNQTMYCTDCHGSDTTRTTAGKETVMPIGNTTLNTNTYTGEDGNAWGPHGSTNPFILKGLWNTSTGVNQQTNGLCFKCHNYSVYTGDGTRTGFWITGGGAGNGNDGHKIHNSKSATSGKIKCNWCHIAVPHGWKNKALLVNLRDVGPEAGQLPGTDVGIGPYSNGPYYRNAMLRVTTFKKSGNWTDADCGGNNYMKDTMCNSVP